MDFPTLTTGIDPDKYECPRQPKKIRAESESGHVQERPRTTRWVRVFSIEYTNMPASEAAIIDQFEKDNMCAIFNFTLPGGEVVKVRFADAVVPKPSVTMSYWNVSFKLEEV